MEDLQEYAENIADQYITAMGHSRGYITRLEWQGDYIEIQFESSYCGCCSPDHDTEHMPISYLWDTDWKDELEDIKKQRERQALLEKEREEAARAEVKRIADLKKIAELKAKYEQED